MRHYRSLGKKEGEHIKNTECVNKLVAGRSVKEYYEDNKDKLKEYKKEYREQNKDKMKEYNREYRDKHKEQIQERRSTKCLCGCGKEYAFGHKSTHQKSIFHQNWLKENS